MNLPLIAGIIIVAVATVGLIFWILSMYKNRSGNRYFKNWLRRYKSLLQCRNCHPYHPPHGIYGYFCEKARNFKRRPGRVNM